MGLSTFCVSFYSAGEDAIAGEFVTRSLLGNPSGLLDVVGKGSILEVQLEPASFFVKSIQVRVSFHHCRVCGGSHQIVRE